MHNRQPCCQAHHEHLARAEAAFKEAEANRETPATITDADHLDAMKAVRLAQEAITSHERWHVRQDKRLDRHREVDERLARSSARLRETEAALSSHALADALRSFQGDEPTLLIDDADRVHSAIIVGAIYDHYADTGHWPTMDATAARVADEMGATYSAARQAVSVHVQGAYTAAQTVVLANHGEAVPEGPDDRWRLMVRDHDVRRLAVRRELDEHYDALVDGWRSHLSEWLES